MLIFKLWSTPRGSVVQADFACQTMAAFLNTDQTVIADSALSHHHLIFPGSSLATPSGPGISLEQFKQLINSLTDKSISAHISSLFSTAIQPIAP
jgi:hypothetical protein